MNPSTNVVSPLNREAADVRRAAPARARPVTFGERGRGTLGKRGRTGHPLGPLVRMVTMDRPVRGRIYAAVVAAGVLALFMAAARLTPSGRHVGTHRQLGLPPCGFMVMTGLPCPTCGMTTAFACTARGWFLPAIRAQFAGFVMAMATAAAGLIALAAVLTGRRPAFNWYRISPTRILWLAMSLVLAAWGANMVLTLI